MSPGGLLLSAMDLLGTATSDADCWRLHAIKHRVTASFDHNVLQKEKEIRLN